MANEHHDWQNDYNPFSQALLKNPQTGKFLSNVETRAERAAFNEQAHDEQGVRKSRLEQGLIATATDVEHDSPAVKQYIGQMVEAVRNWQGETLGLRKLIPIIIEVDSFAQHDTTLKQTEKDRIRKRAQELVGYIEAKTALSTRLRERIKSAVYKEGPSARGKLADSMSQRYGLLGKLAATALRPAASHAGRDSALRHVRASALGGIAERFQATMATPKPVAHRTLGPTPEGVEGEAPSGSKVVKTGGESTAFTGLLKTDEEILTTSKAILAEEQAQTRILTGAQERAAQLDEADERHSVEGKSTAATLTPTGKVEKVAKTGNTGLIGNLLGALGKGITGIFEGIAAKLGVNSVATLASRTLGPAFNALTSGAKALATAALTTETVVAGAGAGLGAALFGGFLAALKHDTNPANRPTADALKDSNTPAGIFARGFTAIQKQPMLPTAPKPAEPLRTEATANADETAPVVPTIAPGLKSSLDAQEFTPEPAPERPVAPAVTKVPSAPPVNLTPPATPQKIKGATDIDARGVAFIQQHEGGFVAHPYEDPKGSGHYAIGYGSHTFKGQDVTALYKANPKFTITKAEADADMTKRLRNEFVPVVRKSLKRPVSQDEFNTLVSIAWNRGIGAYQKDKAFLDKVNNGEALPSSGDFTRAHGTKLSGQDLKGIEKRRRDEFVQYSTGFNRNRDATTVAALTAATQPTQAPPMIVAPTTNIQHGGGGAMPPLMPMPIQARNPDDRIRAIISTNNF